MKVEFTGRFADRTPKTDEEKQNDDIQRLLDPEYVPEKKIKYTYDPVTIELSDVSAWIRLDKNHTQLNTYDKDVYYIIKLPHGAFSDIYVKLTGEKVYVISATTTPMQLQIDAIEEMDDNLLVDEEDN